MQTQTDVDTAQECPICGGRCASFGPGPAGRRERSMCPQCRSLERHRLTWLFLTTETDLLSGQRPARVLYVAPEVSIVPQLQRLEHIDLLTADLDSPVAMVKMDITDIHYPDGSFDAIFCSHVLEHVPDDRLAMRELHRVLSPGGWAILHVPLWRPDTVEDPTVTDPEERTRLFGQYDHVRHYGIDDFPARLAQAGFHVTVDAYGRRIGRAAAERFGLLAQESVHLARKLDDAGPGSVSNPIEALTRLDDAVAGRVQSITGGTIRGWAWDPAAPDQRLTVIAMLDGVEVGTAVADQPRPSLVAAGLGDGAYGFELTMDGDRPASGHHHLRVQLPSGRALAPALDFTTDFADSHDPLYVLRVD